MPIAVLAGAAALVLYLASMPGGVGWWDTGEFQTVPYIAGILHPTGFPAYTLLGWLWSHAFACGNVAWRMNVFAGLAAASATGMLVACAQSLGVSRWTALASGLAFAASGAVWLHGSRAGVESLVLAFGAAGVACGCAWARTARTPYLAGIAGFAGLALATHLVAIWFVPGFMLFVFAGVRMRRPNLRAWILAAIAGVAALATYAYLPLRSAAVSAANLDPVARTLGLRGLAFWDTDHPASIDGFVRLTTGSDFHAGSSLAAIVTLAAYPSYIERLGEIAFGSGDGITVALAIGGTIILARRAPLVALALVVTAFAVIPFSLAYGVLVDAQKYYLVTIWCIALATALGAHAAAGAFARVQRFAPALPALWLCFIAVGELTANAANFQQRGTSDGRAIIREVQQFVPDGALVFAGWSYATPLAYAAYVESSLGTRIPVTNVDHADIAGYAHRHTVYYLPFPENELDLPGAALVPVDGAWPPLYHVVANR